MYYLGVDVGTASVRAGLIHKGRVVGTAVEPIRIHNPKPDHYEQCSEEIWRAVVCTVHTVLKEKDVRGEEIGGIGFDATCSLVVQGQPKQGVGEDPEFDIIMWMDHRAAEEAAFISDTRHPVLDYVGGGVSLEMQLPKLLWLKKNKPEVWRVAQQFFDLPDWLTYRATGCTVRSFCSLICKWNYFVPTSDQITGWDSKFFETIGLEDLAINGWQKIGNKIQAPGVKIGCGLSPVAAEELGLPVGTAVGTSLIDAHAGAAGMLKGLPELVGNLGLVSGTSTCHMLLSRSSNLVPGVWGPYYSAILEGLWLMEGGQSATGSLLDMIITSHPAYPSAQQAAEQKKLSIYAYLEQLVEATARDRQLQDCCYLTADFHMTADFHGNRSPLADPKMKGSMVGLTLATDESSLVLQYLGTLQSICYGTRHILDTLAGAGHDIHTVSICGGLAKSNILLHTMANVLGKDVLVPDEPESVLLGAGLLGMSAQAGKPLQDVLSGMEGTPSVIKPSKDEKVGEFHCRKYRVYLKMIQDQQEYRAIMNQE